MGVFLGMSIFGHAKHLCKFMPFLTSFLVRLFMKFFVSAATPAAVLYFVPGIFCFYWLIGIF